MPLEAIPTCTLICYSIDMTYMVAVLSPEMGFTLTKYLFFVCMCVCLSVFMSPIHVCMHPSIYPSIYLFIHPTIYLSCLPPNPPYPHTHPSIHLFFYLILLSEICDHLIFVLVIKQFLPFYRNCLLAGQYCLFTRW
jgi:hypothetical protein